MYRKCWTVAIFFLFLLFQFLIWLSFVSSTGNSQVHWTVNGEKSVPSFWNLCTDIYTHKHASLLQRQKVIIMDEQAATCPCRCHCYALKKTACVCSTEQFFLAFSSSKNLGLMIICCIYRSSQMLDSHLFSYLIHLLQDPLKSDPMIFLTVKIWAEPSEHENKGCTTFTNICSFVTFPICKVMIDNCSYWFFFFFLFTKSHRFLSCWWGTELWVCNRLQHQL